MPNKLVIFPSGKKTAADAYKAWADGKNAVLSNEPGGIFTDVRVDAFGQWVCAYLGPPYTIDGINEVQEPAGGEAMRADGVLHDYAVWPESPPLGG